MTPQLRDYQLESNTRVREELSVHAATLVQQATGCGKTEQFLWLAKEWPSRVVIMAHRDELIRQPAKRYKRMFGVDVGIEKGPERVAEMGHFLDRHKVILTSVQTMCRPNRMAKFNPRNFGLLVVDEAHHAAAQTYRRVIAHFRQNENLKVVGYTATPNRGDKLALSPVFKSVAYRLPIQLAVERGWLVPIRQQVVKVDGLDFSRVRTVKGDLDKEELERILTEEKVLHRVAAPAVELAGDSPTLVFCVTVNHAKLMAEVLSRYKGTGSALYLSGDRKLFPLPVRQKVLKDFSEGKFQFLCSCNLLLEGFDSPNAAVLVQARPTKSPVVYEQALGRITRRFGVPEGIDAPEARKKAIAASPKPFGTVLDFVGNAGRHKLIQAADLLGGRYTPDVREYAKKALEEDGEAVPLEQALEEARIESEYLAEIAELERRRHVRADAVTYRTENVSPFEGGSVAPTGPAPARKGLPATDKQVKYLRHLGVPEQIARTYSVGQAGAVIDSILQKREGQRT